MMRKLFNMAQSPMPSELPPPNRSPLPLRQPQNWPLDTSQAKAEDLDPPLAPNAENIAIWAEYPKSQRNLDEIPKGYPRICLAQYINDSNRPFLRRFRALNQTCIGHLGLMLAYYEKELMEIDMEVSKTRQHQSPLEYGFEDDVRSSIIDKICPVLMKYYDLILRSDQIRAFRSADMKEHEGFLKFVQNQGLSQQALCYYKDPSDCMIAQSRSNGVLHNLPYWLAEKPWADRFFTNDPVTNQRSLESDWIIRLGVLVMVTTSSFLLLTPIALLYFGGLSMMGNAAVVIFFVILFPFLLYLFAFKQPKAEQILLAQSGIAAVLVTFLSNIIL